MVEKVGGGVGGDICFKTPVGRWVELKFLSVGGVSRHSIDVLPLLRYSVPAVMHGAGLSSGLTSVKVVEHGTEK